MNVALVVAAGHRGCTLKDVAGGFGTVFRVGESFLARLLERAKRHVADLPPVSLAYLDAIFTADGHEVAVLDIKPGGGETWRAVVAQADLVLIHSSIVDCHTERRVAQVARDGGAWVGVFGTFAGRCPEHYLGAAHFAVLGEIEALAPALAGGERPAGLVEAGLVPDLAALPLPRWERFDLSRYRYRIITGRGITLPVQGSRGCSYGCDYCPYLVDSRYRTRSVESLADEIAWLAGRYGARGISYRDPLRLFDLRQAEQFGELLRQRRVAVRFSMESRTDRLDPALLDVLHRAGLRSLEIGVESADPATVGARGRRPPSTEQQERVIAHCHRLGIRVIANFLLGLPNDDEAGMRRSVEYARRLNTFAVQFTVATPYPGTALHDEVKDRITEPDWERFDGWTNVFQHPSMSAEAIHALRERAYVGYHFRPRYAWRLLRELLRTG